MKIPRRTNLTCTLVYMSGFYQQTPNKLQTDENSIYCHTTKEGSLIGNTKPTVVEIIVLYHHRRSCYFTVDLHIFINLRHSRFLLCFLMMGGVNLLKMFQVFVLFFMRGGVNILKIINYRRKARISNLVYSSQWIKLKQYMKPILHVTYWC